MRPLLSFPKSLVISLAVIFSLASFAESGDDINMTDSQGKRQGYWQIKGSMTIEDGYRDNQVVEEGSYVDNKRTGLWKKYYPTGALRNEITFKNNMPRGAYKIYYPNGNMEEKGVWLGNKNTNSFKRYYENGKLAQDFSFSASGKRNGVQNYYYDNGNLQLTVEVKEGVTDGFYKTFYPDGNPKKSMTLMDGVINEESVEDFPPITAELAFVSMPEIPEQISKPNKAKKQEVNAFEKSGETALYNHRKQVTQIGEFKNGRLWNGKWHRYDPQGKLKKVEVYQEGKFIGNGLLEEAAK